VLEKYTTGPQNPVLNGHSKAALRIENLVMGRFTFFVNFGLNPAHLV